MNPSCRPSYALINPLISLQNNIKCTVYEREDASSYQTRPREWGMTLHWGATYIAKCIPPELEARLNEICCDPFYGDRDLTLPHYNGKTGEKLFAMPGENPRRISRRKLRNFLTEGIDVEVRFTILNVMSYSICSVRKSPTRALKVRQETSIHNPPLLHHYNSLLRRRHHRNRNPPHRLRRRQIHRP